MVNFTKIVPRASLRLIPPRVTYVPSQGLISKVSRREILENMIAHKKYEFVQDPGNLYFRWGLYVLITYLGYKGLTTGERQDELKSSWESFFDHKYDHSFEWNSLENQFEKKKGYK